MHLQSLTPHSEVLHVHTLRIQRLVNSVLTFKPLKKNVKKIKKDINYATAPREDMFMSNDPWERSDLILRKGAYG